MTTKVEVCTRVDTLNLLEAEWEVILNIGSSISVVCELIVVVEAVVLASSTWLAIAYLSQVYMAVSVMNACFLSFFPLQFAREGAVASASGIMDFATYLGTGLSSVVFGVLIENCGYGAMFASWAVLCGIGLALQRKK